MQIEKEGLRLMISEDADIVLLSCLFALEIILFFKPISYGDIINF